jgi:hypothetical protein
MDLKPTSTLCLFCAYFNGESIPIYIRVYLMELKRHYSIVRLLTNTKELASDSLRFLEINHFELRLYQNEGFDFGMWSKALKEIASDDYAEIALVNDSCILFRKLDDVMNTIRSSDWDYSGLVYSRSITYHIQSYFVVIRKSIVKTVQDYFLIHGNKGDFESVIIDYEVGLSDFLLKKGFKLGTVYETPADFLLNPSFMKIKELIRQGFPLIKRKLISGNYRNAEIRGLLLRGFNFNPNHYIKFIHRYGDELILDPASMKTEKFNWRLLNFFSGMFWIPLAILHGLKNLIKK